MNVDCRGIIIWIGSMGKVHFEIFDYIDFTANLRSVEDIELSSDPLMETSVRSLSVLLRRNI